MSLPIGLYNTCRSLSNSHLFVGRTTDQPAVIPDCTDWPTVVLQHLVPIDSQRLPLIPFILLSIGR